MLSCILDLLHVMGLTGCRSGSQPCIAQHVHPCLTRGARMGRCMTTVSTLAAAVMTPALTGLLVGTLVPVDTVGLLVSTLQVGITFRLGTSKAKVARCTLHKRSAKRWRQWDAWPVPTCCKGEYGRQST